MNSRCSYLLVTLNDHRQIYIVYGEHLCAIFYFGYYFDGCSQHLSGNIVFIFLDSLVCSRIRRSEERR